MIEINVVIKALREGTRSEQEKLADQLEAIAAQIKAQREQAGPVMGAAERGFGNLLENL